MRKTFLISLFLISFTSSAQQPNDGMKFPFIPGPNDPNFSCFMEKAKCVEGCAEEDQECYKNCLGRELMCLCNLIQKINPNDPQLQTCNKCWKDCSENGPPSPNCMVDCVIKKYSNTNQVSP